MQSLMLNMQGKATESMATVTQALEIAPEEDSRVRSLAYYALAGVCQLNVVPTVGGQTAAHCQQFLGQNGLGYAVSSRIECLRQELCEAPVLLPLAISRGDDSSHRFPVPGKGDLDLGLWNGNDDYGPGTRQRVGRAEGKAGEIGPMKLSVDETLPEMPFDFHSQVTQMLDRYNPTLVAPFREPREQFVRHFDPLSRKLDTPHLTCYTFYDG
jgi:hypothetical protein